MIYLALVIHLILIWINHYISKSLLYPPTVFVMLWGAVLLLLILAGDFFYPLSDLAIYTFLAGSIAFTFGGALSRSLSRRPAVRNLSSVAYRRRFLDCSIVGILILFPFYIIRLKELSALSGITDFWIGLRVQTSTGLKDELGFGIFSYFGAFLTFSGLAAFSETINSSYSKRKGIALVLLVFAYHMASAARTGAVVFLFSLACVSFLSSGLKLKSSLISVVVFILVFIIPAVILGKGGSTDYGIYENFISLKENFQIYALGGPVAFSQSILSSSGIESNYRSFSFFLNLFKALGFDVDVVSSNLDYITTPHLTNVYSIYFPYYYDFGFTGVIFVMTVLGFVLSVVYRHAKMGDPRFIFLYSLSFSSLLLSIFSEAFMTSLSYWIQAAFFAFIFYKMPSRISHKIGSYKT